MGELTDWPSRRPAVPLRMRAVPRSQFVRRCPMTVVLREQSHSLYAPAPVEVGDHACLNGSWAARWQQSLPAVLLAVKVWRFLDVFSAFWPKQGVALTGRNRTGSPCSVAVELYN